MNPIYSKRKTFREVIGERESIKKLELITFASIIRVSKWLKKVLYTGTNKKHSIPSRSYIYIYMH